MKSKQKTSFYKVWENFGLKNNIYYPDEIFSFLEKAIEATNGRLNIDFYGGGYFICTGKISRIIFRKLVN